jgi:hypothetical protein
MNKQTQEALKMVIDTLFNLGNKFAEINGEVPKDIADSINACKEALEQPAQEPVAWYWNSFKGNEPHCDVKRGSPKLDHIFGEPIPLYTHPAQPLSDDEMSKVFDDIVAGCYGDDDFWFRFARAIEQAHGIGVK